MLLVRGDSHVSAPTDRSIGSSMFSLEPDEALHVAARAHAAAVRHTTTTIEADALEAAQCLTKRSPVKVNPVVTPMRTLSAPLDQAALTKQESGLLSTQRRSTALQALKERRALQRHASGAEALADAFSRVAPVDGNGLAHVCCRQQGSSVADVHHTRHVPAAMTRSAPRPLTIPGSTGEGTASPLRHMQGGGVHKPTSPGGGRATSPQGRRRHSQGAWRSSTSPAAARCVCVGGGDLCQHHGCC